MRLVFFLLLGALICRCQDHPPILLSNANFASSIPVMAMGRGQTLYVAYRSFTGGHSDRLEVAAYDVNTEKELLHKVFAVPLVHSPRVADGLYLSNDGEVMAYAEVHDPGMILLLSTKDLTEIRRSNHIPFGPEDRHLLYKGFDTAGTLMFASTRPSGIRFLHIDPQGFNIVSEVTTGGPTQPDVGVESIVWAPAARVTWIATSPDVWKQYTEDGRPTGQELRHRGTARGVVGLGESGLLAFFGKWADGEVVVYNDHHTQELKVDCSPHLYGSSNDRNYAGAMCTTSPDREPERGGNKILSSEYLLFQLSGPSIVWRQKMNFINVAEGHGLNMWFQNGNPLIYRIGDGIWIVAPGKSPEVKIYRVELRNSSRNGLREFS